MITVKADLALSLECLDNGCGSVSCEATFNHHGVT